MLWSSIIRPWKSCARVARGAALTALLGALPAMANEPIYLARPDDNAAISIAADHAEHWQQGSYDVWHIAGHCHVRQGTTDIGGPEAVLWVDQHAEPQRPDQPTKPNLPLKVIAYFEGTKSELVTLANSSAAAAAKDASAGELRSPEWFGRLISRRPLEMRFPAATDSPAEKPPIVARGLAHFGPQPYVANQPVQPVEQAQFTQTVPAPAPLVPQGSSYRKVQIFSRSDIGYHIETLRSPEGESVVTLSGGVNIVIQGLSVQGLPAAFGPLGDVDIEADRVVLWGLENDAGGLGPTPGKPLTQQNEKPLEIYMEGNIIFRQGDRTVYATRMFYDVRRQLGIILDAELLMPPPNLKGTQYQGLIRLKAASLKQLDQSRFVAQDGFVTTSRLAEPSYDLAGRTITFTDTQQPVLDPTTGQPVVDPRTGQPAFAHENLLQSESNFVYVSGVPVFYWPSFTTNLERPTYYIDNFRIRNDSVFGFQVLTELDMFQLLGYNNPPAGVRWDLNLDFLSQRGLGFGTNTEYDRDSFFGIPGPTSGRADAWFINDGGHDNLGADRRDIVPEAKFRGRAFWNHREKFADGLLQDWTLQGEVGWISDRTFLEEYYENEWDNNKDQITGVRLKRLLDNQTFSIEANGRINDFFTQTQWLPRFDHYWLGEPLLDDQLTWYEHSSAAYANIGIASIPTNLQLKSEWSLLPWEHDSAGNAISGQGERFITRQELDLPLDFAPFKVVPYAIGELGHWGQDINGNDIDRAWYQAGVRASIPFWAVDPNVHDALFNLNGLAHKVVFDAEASFSEANRDLTQFPLYDELDDDSIEEFRRRLFFAPFGGGLLPNFYKFGGLPPSLSFIDPKFDPRFYALRSGLQDSVSSPSSEIVDDLAAVRLGMHNRLQTKRGAPGEEHIVDWLTFDTNVTYFPDANRDNFGTDFGLADYDLRWHLGDRFTVLSDGEADFFGEGLKTAALGVQLTRPQTGNAYLGFRVIDGLINADIFTAAVNYRLGPKWIASASTSYDMGQGGNLSQTAAVSRIGESLIATIGGHIDESKGDVGFSFLLEPRFLPKTQTASRTGIEIPPVGVDGLE
jgi:hypothetical protein